MARLEDQRRGLPVPLSRPGMVQISALRSKVALLVKAPSVMSLEAGRDEFLGLLYDWRYRLHVEPRIKKGTASLTSIDLTDVSQLDLDAALVLTAEYHRSCRLRSYRPWVNDETWQPDVVRLLQDLGFYDFMDAAGRSNFVDLPEDPRRFVKFVFGRKVRGEQADELIEALRKVGGETPAREAVYGALVEAIMNVHNHAYKDRPEEVFAGTEDWWAAGSYNPAEQTLEFVVYDQGVGIPTRLPRNPDIFTRIVALLKGDGDASLIEAAIEFGRSSTDLPERGNGLWMICRLAEELDGSFVRILSGHGDVTYFSQRGLEKKDHDNPFCGTLIKWTLQLPSESPLTAGGST